MKEAEAESCLTEFQRRGQSGLTRIGENSIKKQGFQLKHGETIRTWLMGREVGFVGIQKKKSRRGKERQESRSGSQEKRSSIFLTLCTCFSSGSLFLFFKIFIWLHWVLGVARGILFSDQASNSWPPALWARSLSHWATREALGVYVYDGGLESWEVLALMKCDFILLIRFFWWLPSGKEGRSFQQNNNNKPTYDFAVSSFFVRIHEEGQKKLRIGCSVDLGLWTHPQGQSYIEKKADYLIKTFCFFLDTFKCLYSFSLTTQLLIIVTHLYSMLCNIKEVFYQYVLTTLVKASTTGHFRGNLQYFGSLGLITSVMECALSSLALALI